MFVIAGRVLIHLPGTFKGEAIRRGVFPTQAQNHNACFQFDKTLDHGFHIHAPQRRGQLPPILRFESRGVSKRPAWNIPATSRNVPALREAFPLDQMPQWEFCSSTQ